VLRGRLEAGRPGSIARARRASVYGCLRIYGASPPLIQAAAALYGPDPDGQIGTGGIPFPVCITAPDGFCRNKLPLGFPLMDRFFANSYFVSVAPTAGLNRWHPAHTFMFGSTVAAKLGAGIVLVVDVLVDVEEVVVVGGTVDDVVVVV
jgi:hypothetical protein